MQIGNAAFSSGLDVSLSSKRANTGKFWSISSETPEACRKLDVLWGLTGSFDFRLVQHLKGSRLGAQLLDFGSVQLTLNPQHETRTLCRHDSLMPECFPENTMSGWGAEQM